MEGWRRAGFVGCLGKGIVGVGWRGGERVFVRERAGWLRTPRRGGGRCAGVVGGLRKGFEGEEGRGEEWIL